METPVQLKWSDPEYKREYFRKYYHANKVLKNNRKNIDWEDPEAVKKYYQDRWIENKQEYVCEICRCTTYNKKKHENTQRHKNGLKVFEKLKFIETSFQTN